MYQHVCKCSPEGYLYVSREDAVECLVAEEMYDLDFDDRSMEMLRSFVTAGDRCLSLNAYYDALRLFRHVFDVLPWDSKGEAGNLFQQAVSGMCSATGSRDECAWECGSDAMAGYWQWREDNERETFGNTLLRLHNGEPVGDEDMEDVRETLLARRFKVCFLLSPEDDTRRPYGLEDDEIRITPVVVSDDVLKRIFCGFTYDVFVLSPDVNAEDILRELSRHGQYSCAPVVVMGDAPAESNDNIHVCRSMKEVKSRLWDYCVASLINGYMPRPLRQEECLDVYSRLFPNPLNSQKH